MVLFVCIGFFTLDKYKNYKTTVKDKRFNKQ